MNVSNSYVDFVMSLIVLSLVYLVLRDRGYLPWGSARYPAEREIQRLADFLTEHTDGFKTLTTSESAVDMAIRLLSRPAPAATAPAAGPEEDVDWPEPMTLWWWYSEARRAAHGVGVDFATGKTHAEDHPALDAALAIGQMEGARLKADPAATVPLLTATELDDRVFQLLADDDAGTDAENPGGEAEKGKIGLWRMNGIAGGKYLVTRRDGTTYPHPNLVLGARDPAAPAGLLGYAAKAEELGMDPKYVANVRSLAPLFEQYRLEHGDGDPDAGPHRKDDPATVAKMVEGGSV